MIRYDGDVIYMQSEGGLRATSRVLFNEAQVTGIKSIAGGLIKQQTDFKTVYVVKDQRKDAYGPLELIFVFEKLNDAQEYTTKHPRAVIMPRKVK